MPPSTLPKALTESARELRQTFFCDLCQKGYSRSNELEAHEGSYDHQHRKRLKDMKAFTKNPGNLAGGDGGSRREKGKKNEDADANMVKIQIRDERADGQERNGGGGGFVEATRPKGGGGFIDATAPVVQEAETKMDVDERENQDDAVEYEMRPPTWEELGTLPEFLDLETNQPAGANFWSQSLASHEEMMADPGFHAEIQRMKELV